MPSTTLASSAWILGTRRSTHTSDLWKVVFNRLWYHVNNQSIWTHPKGSSYRWIVTEFPDSEIEKESDYPLVSMSELTPDDEKKSQDKKFINYALMLTIKCRSAEQLSNVVNVITEAMVNVKRDLFRLGIYKIDLVSSESDHDIVANTSAELSVMTLEYSFKKSYGRF